MAEDAMSDAQDTTAGASATEDEATQAEQMLADAINGDGEQDAKAGEENGKAKPSGKDSGKQDDQLGNAGKQALIQERQARREAEKQLKALNERLAKFEDRDKTELQKALERAEAAEKAQGSMRVANARLMAAAVHNIPPDLIDLLGDGTDEEIEGRAKLLAEKLATAAPDPAEEKPAPKPKPRRPVESLTPGAKPAGEKPTNPNDLFRSFLAKGRH